MAQAANFRQLGDAWFEIAKFMTPKGAITISALCKDASFVKDDAIGVWKPMVERMLRGTLIPFQELETHQPAVAWKILARSLDATIHPFLIHHRPYYIDGGRAGHFFLQTPNVLVMSPGLSMPEILEGNGPEMMADFGYRVIPNARTGIWMVAICHTQCLHCVPPGGCNGAMMTVFDTIHAEYLFDASYRLGVAYEVEGICLMDDLDAFCSGVFDVGHLLDPLTTEIFGPYPEVPALQTHLLRAPHAFAMRTVMDPDNLTRMRCGVSVLRAGGEVVSIRMIVHQSPYPHLPVQQPLIVLQQP